MLHSGFTAWLLRCASSNRCLKVRVELSVTVGPSGNPPLREHCGAISKKLPQRAYRYESPAQKVLDGTIFVFAKGTNPELLLLIEVRKQENGARWFFTMACMTIRKIEVLHRDKTLETKPALGSRERPYRVPQQPYYEFRRNLKPRGDSSKGGANSSMTDEEEPVFSKPAITSLD